MKKIRRIVLAALILWIPANAFAWGMIGHRVVGEIADYYLTAKARLAIKKLIGNESLAMASNWPDFIKSDTSYKYLDSWHYVNLPAGLDRNGVYDYLSLQKAPNIYNKTLEMIEVLKSKNSTLAEKQQALRLIIHFIGDMHQPMHTARLEDLGGNRLQVTWFNEKTNMHRVWDEQLVAYQKLSYTEYAKAINYPAALDLKKWRTSSIKEVIYESYEACNKIYAYSKPDDKLSYRYNFDFVDTLNVQLLKGGIRLSKVLNDIYK